MAELKTKKTEQSVEAFISTVEPAQKRADCEQIIAIMSEVTKAPPKMWGGAIIGFGDNLLKYDSGRELDWFVIGFSPRKANIAFYIGGISQHPDLAEKLGKFKTGKGCLYINTIKDIDITVLKTLMKRNVKAMKGKA